jgi:hypothetical protein
MTRKMPHAPGGMPSDCRRYWGAGRPLTDVCLIWAIKTVWDSNGLDLLLITAVAKLADRRQRLTSNSENPDAMSQLQESKFSPGLGGPGWTLRSCCSAVVRIPHEFMSTTLANREGAGFRSARRGPRRWVRARRGGARGACGEGREHEQGDQDVRHPGKGPAIGASHKLLSVRNDRNTRNDRINGARHLPSPRAVPKCCIDRLWSLSIACRCTGHPTPIGTMILTGQPWNSCPPPSGSSRESRTSRGVLSAVSSGPTRISRSRPGAVSSPAMSRMTVVPSPVMVTCSRRVPEDGRAIGGSRFAMVARSSKQNVQALDVARRSSAPG